MPKALKSYRQLVVRVWGWSAYFVELDKEFQDHIIARHAIQFKVVFMLGTIFYIEEFTPMADRESGQPF